MFKRPTVFVVGAGASNELGLPLGSVLRASVADDIRFRFQRAWTQVSGDADLYETLKRAFPAEINDYSTAANKLSDASSHFQSIDEAIHFVSDDPKATLIGKVAIASRILKAERNSLLFNDSDPKRAALANSAGTWLSPFLSMSLGLAKESQLGEIFGNVTIINFNYDRSVEHYLFSAIRESFGRSETAAASILGGLRVVRPYGSVGSLPRQVKAGGIGYGASVRDELISLSQNIGTYTESFAGADVDFAITRSLQKAELIILIGFGYLQSNMPLLTVETSRPAKVIGSVFGIDANNYDDIRQQLSSSLKPKSVPQLLDYKAAWLLNALQPTLQRLVS